MDVPGDLDDSPAGDELFDYLREKAEFVNHHYCSGLGSMGGIAFDFRFLTDNDNESIEKGWLVLDKPEDEYDDTVGDDGETIPDNSKEFVNDATIKIEEELDIDLSDSAGEYDAIFVVGRNRDNQRYSKAFCQGELWPDGVDIPIVDPIFNNAYFIDSEYITSRFEEAERIPGVEIVPTPVRTTNGWTNGIYETVGRNLWRHELGHSIGEGNQIGFPDLKGGFPQDLGEVGEWGLMGHGDVITSFSRVWGGDLVRSREWLSRDSVIFDLRDKTVELSPLTEKESGDSAKCAWSVYSEFTIDVGWDPRDIEVSFSLISIERYHFEVRKDYTQSFGNPDNGPLETTPVNNPYDGVVIYRQNFPSPGGSVELGRLLDGKSPITMDDFWPSYDFMQNEAGDMETPTLTAQGSSDLSSHYDSEGVTEFSLVQSGPDGSYEIELDRDVSELVPPGFGWATEIVVDYFVDKLFDVFPGGNSLPPLEVFGVTPDGRRVGIEPETGERINEIEGATVTIRGSATSVRVPGDEDVEFSVSAIQLKAALDELGIDYEDRITYEQKTIIDNDPSLEVIGEVEDVGPIPHIDGRVTQLTTGTIDDTDEEQRRALITSDISISPERLNVKSEGNWVSCWIAIPDDLDPRSIIHETIVLETVQAESDDSYGFVENPPVKEEDGDTYVNVKFPREEIISALQQGTQTITMCGIVGETPFRGNTDIELFEPGAGNGDNGNNGNGNNSNGDR